MMNTSTRLTAGCSSRSLGLSVRNGVCRGHGSRTRAVEARAIRDENASELKRREVLSSVLVSVSSLGALSVVSGTPLPAFADDAEELLPVSKLPNRAKQAQIEEIYKIIKGAVDKNVTADDYRSLLQLAFLDALSNGGSNGSIRNEIKSLGLPNLSKAVDQVVKAKEDAEKASPYPLTFSFADMLVMSAYYATLKHFKQTIIGRSSDPQGAAIILQAYANDIQIPKIGRVDATGDSSGGDSISLKTTDLAQRALDAGLITGQVAALAAAFPTASLEEAEEEMKGIDSKFDTYVATYVKSRKELTQTTYQINVGRAFAKVTTLGAKFEPERYYHPIPKPRLPKKL